MGIKRETGFVLNLYPYKETSSIVVLLTKNEGIKKGIAKGLGRKKTNLKELLSQFSEVEVQFYEGEKGQLVTFTEAEILNSVVFSIINSPCPFILSYFAEILLSTVPEGQPNEKVYKLIKHIIDGFSKNVQWQKLKIYFDYWIIKLNGILPQKFLCKCKSKANYYSYEKNEFYCTEHKNGIEFPKGFMKFLEELKEKNIFSIPNFDSNLEFYKFANQIFYKILLNFLQREIKSYNFLKTCDKLFIV